MLPEAKNKLKRILLIPLLVLFCLMAIVVCTLAVLSMQHKKQPIPPAADVQIMDLYDAFLSDQLHEAEDAARSVPKIFWLADDADKGPVPNPDCYGSTDDPATLGWLLEDAAKILDGQKTLFSVDTEIMPGSNVSYYLDDTIFAVVWKEVRNNYVYTVAEVKVSHPSQFRRHVADGMYNSPNLYPTTVMSKEVNAVVGSSADHYRGREFGTKVYDGVVRTVNLAHACDVCYIDKNGDLIFSYRGELMDKESVQKFIDSNNISFSISFGPILVDDGKYCAPSYYALGEINDKYARAALCQMGPLHYLVVTANSEGSYLNAPTIHSFAEVISTFGCEKAYTLDGGNTGAIAMDGKLINRTTFGYERNLSDIIYFCTALPDHNTYNK